MKCPTCPDATLVMTDRQGIEIDYCPQCRGVWLDRGELDKIIERGAQTAPQSAAPPAQPPQQHYPQATRHPDFEDSDFKRRSPYGYRKPKSWLSDIFD